MRVGILGSGQLGRMLALAGYPLGLEFALYSPAADPCGASVAPHTQGPFEVCTALEEFLAGIDVLTYEFENIPASLTEYLEQHTDVHPPARALAIAQDRLCEKQFLRRLGLDPVPFAAVESVEELAAVPFVGAHDAILKSRRLGYDGKGQHAVPAGADLGAFAGLFDEPGKWIVEQRVAFDFEFSQVSVRGRDGSVVHYPPIENTHRGGILRLSRAPSPRIPEALAAEARGKMEAVLRELEYVGTLAIEFFAIGGRAVANEMAPRVHNSGHWTIEGAVTSQFENHLRAVTGLPLGGTSCVGHSAMINIVGGEPDRAAILSLPGAHLHWYGKQPRPGRKLGHVTIVAQDAATCGNIANEVLGMEGLWVVEGASAEPTRPVARDLPLESRRHLPHYEGSGSPLFVTFATHRRLQLPEAARHLLMKHILHDHLTKMRLICAVVMPDHVHLLYEPWSDPQGARFTKTEIVGAIKSASAHSINKLLGRKGPLWQQESFDHVVRKDESIDDKARYIEENPVRKGLCKTPDEYPFLWRGWVEGAKKG